MEPDTIGPLYVLDVVNKRLQPSEVSTVPGSVTGVFRSIFRGGRLVGEVQAGEKSRVRLRVGEARRIRRAAPTGLDPTSYEISKVKVEKGRRKVELHDGEDVGTVATSRSKMAFCVTPYGRCSYRIGTGPREPGEYAFNPPGLGLVAAQRLKYLAWGVDPATE